MICLCGCMRYKPGRVPSLLALRKRVQFPQGCFGTPTWSPFQCFGTTKWLSRHENAHIGVCNKSDWSWITPPGVSRKVQINLRQESPKRDFNWAANFPGGGVAAHLGHLACRWPLRDVASHVRVKQLLSWTCMVPFKKPFVTRKMSTIFKSGLYGTFSNSTIMNKKKVSHSKKEALY